MLIATQGFAALNLVIPNYVVQNGFLPLGNGTLNYAGVDIVSYTGLPADGVSALTRTGAVVPNVATNYGGASASVSAPSTANYSGLWWASPAGVEIGLGDQLRAPGRPHLCDLVHLRPDRQGLVARDDRQYRPVAQRLHRQPPHHHRPAV